MKMVTENDCPVNELLARLTQQQQVLSRQKQHLEEGSSGGTSSNATDPYGTIEPAASVACSDGRPDSAEVLRLQKELEIARERMARMDLELTQSRIAKNTMEEAIGSPFPVATQLALNVGGAPGYDLQHRSIPHHSGRHLQRGRPTDLPYDVQRVAGSELSTSVL